MKASPISPTISYPFLAEPQGKPQIKGWWKQILPEQKPDLPTKPVSAEVSLKTTLGGNKLLLTEFESPFTPSRTVFLLSAKTSADLLLGTLALWEPSLQAKCKNNLILVDLDGPPYKTYVQKAGGIYYLGKIGRISRLDRLVHTYPWHFFGVLVFSLIVLAWILYRLLKRYKTKRIKDEDDAALED